jgi:Flp pilus assembly protein TadD
MCGAAAVKSIIRESDRTAQEVGFSGKNMSRKPGTSKSRVSSAVGLRRSRRWLIWLIGGLAVLVVLMIVGSRMLDRWSVRAQALRLAQQGDLATAEPLLQQAAEYFPKDAEVAGALALAQKATGKLLVEAEPYFDRWCELDPENPLALRERFMIYQALRKRRQAVADGRRLLELEPNDHQLRQWVVELMLVTEQFADAEKLCRAGLIDRPGDPELRYLLALGYHYQGKSIKVDAALRELLDRYPSHFRGLLLQGIRLSEDEAHDRAIPVLRKALAGLVALEDQQNARYHLSRALAAVGQKQEARDLMQTWEQVRRADRLAQDSDQQLGNLAIQIQAAQALLKVGKAGQALQRVERVLQEDVHYPGAQELLAECQKAFTGQQRH